MVVEQRVFSVEEFTCPSEGVPFRSVVLETTDAVIIVWHVAPGQSIAPHTHPAGQDTWTVISGCADYLMGDNQRQALQKESIAVAGPGDVHGAVNTGNEPFVFVSVVSPADAGYELCTGSGVNS